MAHLLPFVSQKAFDELYRFRDYPKFGDQETMVIGCVLSRPGKNIVVKLQWYSGLYTSTNTYCYKPATDQVTIVSDENILFLKSFPVNGLHFWSEWLKRPDLLMKWQIWPAHVLSVTIMPENTVYFDQQPIEPVEIPYETMNSWILHESEVFECKVRIPMEVWKFERKLADEQPGDFVQQETTEGKEYQTKLGKNVRDAVDNYQKFFATVVWSLYQRNMLDMKSTRTAGARMVRVAVQLLLYLRAMSINYDNSYMFLDLFANPIQSRGLNCLGMTVLFCAIMESLGYFPDYIAARVVDGHITLIYRTDKTLPVWDTLELTVDSGWLSKCRYMPLNALGSTNITSATRLITSVLHSYFVDHKVDKQAQSKMKRLTMDFLGKEKWPIEDVFYFRSFIDDFACNDQFFSTDEQKAAVLRLFRIEYASMLESFLWGVFYCRSIWEYIKQNYTTAEIREITQKLKRLENAHVKPARVLAPYPINLLVSSALTVATPRMEGNWDQVWNMRDEVFQDPTIKRPRALDDYLYLPKKRTLTAAATAATSSQISPPNKTARTE